MIILQILHDTSPMYEVYKQNCHISVFMDSYMALEKKLKNV